MPLPMEQASGPLGQLQQMVLDNYERSKGGLEATRTNEQQSAQAYQRSAMVGPGTVEMDPRDHEELIRQSWAGAAATPMGPTLLDTMGSSIGAYNKVLNAGKNDAIKRQQLGAQINYNYSAAQDKQAQDEFLKHETALKGLYDTKNTTATQGAQLSIRAIELLKKNKEHIRQTLKNDTSISPMKMDELVSQRAMQQTISELQSVYTDDQIKQLIPGMWNTINGGAAQPAALNSSAPAEQVSLTRPATDEQPGMNITGSDEAGLAAGLKNAPGGDAMEILNALPPDQRARIERLMRGAAKLKAQGNAAGANARVQQIQAELSGKSTEQLKAEAAGSKKRAELQAEQDVKPTTVGRETAEKEGEQLYSKAFNDQVLAPAMATEETSRIMTQFEQLAKMQDALQSGAIKEWLAGDGGKWIASALPETSELRKGIANAQTGQQLQQVMVNAILMAAKGVQTEGDAQRAVQQLTSIGKQKEANEFMAAYMKETASRHKLRKEMAEKHKAENKSWQGFDTPWQESAYMKTEGSVKRLPAASGQPGGYIGMTEYVKKFRAKNPNASDSDAAAQWNRIK